ncbi:unnamed protein product [Lactuca saligna]|uniref:Uncharacterized protein n=1 Tax=Lactuca saligna TaxID=75948 RepID=A0AA36E489_LACSI|nr:unnamed protein product [Lactuca saligna]
MPGRPSTNRKRDQIERELKGKVKVELAQEVHVASDSDSEVQMEPDSEGEGVVGGVEEHVEVEAQVEVEVQEDEDQAAVEGQEGEELVALQDPVGQDDQGQDAVQDLVEEEPMQEVPSFQVLQGKRRMKPSERITKIQIRMKREGK